MESTIEISIERIRTIAKLADDIFQATDDCPALDHIREAAIEIRLTTHWAFKAANFEDA